MMEDRTQEETLAWLRLSLQPGVSRATARQLLAEFGLPQHIFTASAAALARHLPRDVAAALLSPAPADVKQAMDAAVRMLAQPGHSLITLADAHYPSQLLDSSDPPLLLYVRGNRQLLHQPSVAIVGARNATEGGKDNARAFARHLAQRGWTVVSGLARGIDAAAHEGSLSAGGPGGTVAVLACGLDIAYPRQHAPLMEQIAATGVLVSEYAPGTPAQPFRFPERNRIVAALARGVLVVEAAVQSGSLVTARLRWNAAAKSLPFPAPSTHRCPVAAMPSSGRGRNSWNRAATSKKKCCAQGLHPHRRLAPTGRPPCRANTTAACSPRDGHPCGRPTQAATRRLLCAPPAAC